ncbi:site-specific integrase [Bacillus sp. AFS017336]|uniref:tyrosine-type recombinase/integrase n=1 Tax=Bacillus sp. AFS017336 TaxID=2033489 RepID=UPI000BEFEC25|nr:site-specific integrase [Bacillus sp. AFS017336]PEL03937.1 hypothetical protein CN601_21815 [Bacillus sp. AFS017336]
MRNGELRGIKLEDIKGECIIIKKAKGGKERVVGIPPIVQKQLMTYLRKRNQHAKFNRSDYLLISQHTGIALCGRTILRIINDAGGDVGVHSLRRFFAIQQLEHNDLYSVSRMMGHESIKTTAVYLQSMGDDKIIKRSLEHNPINDLL